MHHPLAHSANRLPITHPEYRYPASKNPYWEKLRDVRGRVFSDNETESRAGAWRDVFPGSPRGPAKLHVEIGCNAGHVINEWAARSPDEAFVGIDWKFKPIFRGAEKAARRGIGNVAFFRAHAERLAFMFGPGEIDHLYLFFPDPWPKKHHWKNRFLTPDKLRDAWRVLKPGGELWIKTDHPGYFAWMERALAEVPGLYELTERSTDLHAGNPDAARLTMPEVTLFERLFIADGIPIHSLRLRKPLAS